MKYTTLLSRFIKAGYPPLGIGQDREIDAIIDWVYKKHDIFISVIYNGSIITPSYMRFTGIRIHECSKSHHHTFYNEVHHKTPQEAKFKALSELLRGINFKMKTNTL